jgi:hypothetical protein
MSIFVLDAHFHSVSLFQLISELGITGGDDAAIGYYAGIIVGGHMTTCENHFLIVYYWICSTGISVFRCAGTDGAEVE